MSGSVIAQIITLVCSILLTRIYNPNELGIYTLILTAESMFGSVICLRYDVSIVSEKSEKRVFSLVKLSLLITLFLSIIAAIGYGYFRFLMKTEYMQYSYAIVFIGLMLFFRGIINVLESFNNRNKEYKLMTSVYIVRTIVQNIGAIILGVLGFGVFGIVLSHTFGLVFGIKKQAHTIINNSNKVIDINTKDLIETAELYYRQPLYSSPAVFANRYSYSSISLFTESLFGAEMLGYYSISYKALGLPLTVLSNNVSKVFFKEASIEFTQTGRFARSFKKTSIVLIILSIPMGLLIYFLAPITFRIIFGETWIQSGIIVQILIPMFCIRFIVNTIAYGLQIVNKQNFELLFQGLLVIMSIISFLLAQKFNLDINMYLKIIAITFSCIYILYYFCVMKFAIYGVKRNN